MESNFKILEKRIQLRPRVSITDLINSIFNYKNDKKSKIKVNIEYNKIIL